MDRSINSSKGYAAAALSAAGFGSMGIFAQTAYAADWPPALLLAVRFVLAALLFWACMPLTRGSWRVDRGTLMQLAGMGIVGYALMAILLFCAYQYIPVGAAVTVFYTYPIWVSLLLARRSRKRLSLHQSIPFILAFFGLAIMFMDAWGTSTSGQLLGYVLAIVCSVVYAFFILLSENVLERTSAYVSSAYITTFAAVPLLLLVCLTGAFQHAAGQAAWQAWGAAGGLAIFSTFGAITLFAYGVKQLGSNHASVISYLEPLFAAALGAALLKQYLAPQQLIGSFIVLTGVLMMQWRDIWRSRQALGPL